MKSLIELFAFPAKSYVALIGSGGKTTLMNQLAQHYRFDYPVLIGTTTKIRVPSDNKCDFNFVDHLTEPLVPQKNGIYVVGTTNPESGKLGMLEEPLLSQTAQHFSYSFLECDGSKMLSLKGWAPYEPIIPKFTTHTIGITNLLELGKPATEQNIHRLSLFLESSGCKENQPITLEHIANMITHSNGLFGKSVGKRVLFISHCDTMEQVTLAKKLIPLLPSEFLETVDRIIAGNSIDFTGSILWEET